MERLGAVIRMDFSDSHHRIELGETVAAQIYTK